VLRVNQEMLEALHASPTQTPPPVDLPGVFPSGATQPWYEFKVGQFLTKLREQTNVGSPKA
jgi:hypothetical protein